MVRAIHDSVRQVKPEIVLSAAVFPDRQDARCRRFQDWAGWACEGLLDLICPMAYSQDTEVFTVQIGDAVESSCGVPVCAGIGAWRISSSSAIDKIHAARRRGAAGFCLFSYSITNSGTETEYLEDIRQSVARESG